jgi:D-alanyl-D-alanine carboxypeptidase (penicillin-binding protein 5/6)
VTLEDAPYATRRARRAATGDPSVTPTDPEPTEGVLTLSSETPPDTAASASVAVSSGSVAAAATGSPEAASTTPLGRAKPAKTPRRASAAEPGHRIALAWVDENAIARPASTVDLSAASASFVPVETDLLAHPPRRSLLRSGVIVPALAIAGVLGAYAATTLAWPLHAVEPTVTAHALQPVSADPASPAWPKAGSAAVSVGGISSTVASDGGADAIASITKIVTALVVLDQMPLAVGEQGPEFRFGYADSAAYWDYRYRGESALDVPVDGVLTQYQLLEGMLVGSANNYADRLAGNLFGSDAVFSSAAMAWLDTHGVDGVTIVEPTGMDPANSATPEALITLAKKAMAHPVIAEIVAKKSVELPGAGVVKNTNTLLADDGVVGLKTGTLDTWNLLSAKDVTIGDTTVRMYASVLGQPSAKARIAASRALYADLEDELQLRPTVAEGTVTGSVETVWGEDIPIVAGEDASVVLWNGGTGQASAAYALGDHREEGDVVGSLTVKGPLDSTTVDLRLAEDIEGPTIWWRLTHPLELFGLND